MKSERGVTLISLGIYIIVIIIVISIIFVISSSFNNTVSDMSKESTSTTELDMFNVYFLQEVKKQGNSISKITDKIEIEFSTGNKYTFKNNKIYLNDNIVISKDVDSCTFEQKEEDGKTIITVSIKLKNAESKTIDYVLNTDNNTLDYQDENVYVYNNTL